jgi:hypothetical protein
MAGPAMMDAIMRGSDFTHDNIHHHLSLACGECAMLICFFLHFG